MSKPTWQNIDVRLPAVIASLLLSCFTFLFPQPLNDDAFLYLRTAELFLSDGVAAAFSHYSWASYSVLIGLVSLLGLPLISAAFLINSGFFALLTYAFISVVRTVDESRTTLVAAAVVVLVFPELNEYRYYIIRDIAFWALVFVALWQLSAHIQDGGKSKIAVFCAALLMAASFRIEAILYLIFIPLTSLILVKQQEQLKRLKTVSACAVAAVVLLPTILLVGGVNGFALATEFISTYKPFFVSAFLTDPEEAARTSTAIFGSYGAIYSGYYLALFLLAGFFALLIVSLANALGLPLLLVVVAGLRRQIQQVRTDKATVLLAAIVINFFIAFCFIYITKFLPSRYSMVLAIAIVALIPLLLKRWFLDVWPQAKQWQRLAPVLIVIYLFIDSYISFGRANDHIDVALAWIEDRQLNQGQLVTNESSIGYFSQLVEDYDGVSDDLFWRNVATTQPGDIIVMENRPSLRNLAEITFSSEEFVLLKSLPDGDKPRLTIYERR